MLETEARTWAMAAHGLAALSTLMSWGTLAIVAPLVIFLIFKDRSTLVAHHAKDNLNLQITVLVSGVVAGVAGFIIFFGAGWLITLPLWGIYVLYGFVISIVAAVKGYNGEYYRIPAVITFIK